MKSNTTSKGNFRLSENLQHEVMHNKANRTDEQKSVVQIVLRSRSQGRSDQCQCQIRVQAKGTNVKSEARLVQLKSRQGNQVETKIRDQGDQYQGRGDQVVEIEMTKLKRRVEAEATHVKAEEEQVETKSQG